MQIERKTKRKSIFLLFFRDAAYFLQWRKIGIFFHISNINGKKVTNDIADAPAPAISFGLDTSTNFTNTNFTNLLTNAYYEKNYY